MGKKKGSKKKKKQSSQVNSNLGNNNKVLDVNDVKVNVTTVEETTLHDVVESTEIIDIKNEDNKTVLPYNEDNKSQIVSSDTIGEEVTTLENASIVETPKRTDESQSKKWGQLPEVESSDSDSDDFDDTISPYLTKREYDNRNQVTPSPESSEHVNSPSSERNYVESTTSNAKETPIVCSPKRKTYPTDEEVRIFHPEGGVPERIATVKTDLEIRILAVQKAKEEEERIIQERRRSIEAIEWSYLRKQDKCLERVEDTPAVGATQDCQQEVISLEERNNLSWAPDAFSSSDSGDSDDDTLIVPKYYGAST